jgi:hypothetical protein
MIGELMTIASIALALLAVVVGLFLIRPRRRMQLALAVVASGGSIFLWVTFVANGLCKVANS